MSFEVLGVIMIACLFGYDAVNFACKGGLSTKFHAVMSKKMWSFSSILLINLTNKYITQERVKMLR